MAHNIELDVDLSGTEWRDLTVVITGERDKAFALSSKIGADGGGGNVNWDEDEDGPRP